MNVRDFTGRYDYPGDGRYGSLARPPHDGDTVECVLSLPLWINILWPVRLKDVWAPELKQPGGPESQTKLASLVANKPVWIRSYQLPRGTGSRGVVMTFERIVCDVWVSPDAMGELIHVNAEMTAWIAAQGYGHGTGGGA